jgi:hypothetical protein
MEAGMCFMAMALAAAAGSAPIAVTVHPDHPLIERTRLGQAINFDFEVVNNGPGPIDLSAIRATVRDPAGAVALRLEVNDNGIAPGIETLAAHSWKAGDAQTIFNPFHTLPADLAIGRIDFEFQFRSGDLPPAPATISVAPAPYRQKTRLVLPMRGRMLVWDGHDFLSHHRRFDFAHPAARELRIATNSGRYSLDLVVVNTDGQFFAGSGNKPQDHFSLGQPVFAPGDGRIAAAIGDLPDEPANVTPEAFRRDAMAAVFGNHVVIDHGNGEFSQLGHLRRGSLRVKAGDTVRAGQEIARAGQSGTSLFPHLHYQLTDGPGFHTEGLPARFESATRILGSTRSADTDVWIDSGDIVEAP